MHFSSGKHEDGVRGWLFEGLQQGVEGRGGEHVDFIDYIYFVASLVGGEVDLFTQVAHVVHAGVGGSIDLDEIQKRASADSPAVIALIAGALGKVFL